MFLIVLPGFMLSDGIVLFMCLKHNIKKKKKKKNWITSKHAWPLHYLNILKTEHKPTVLIAFL